MLKTSWSCIILDQLEMEGGRAKKLTVVNKNGSLETFIAYYPEPDAGREVRKAELWRTYGAPAMVKEWRPSTASPPGGVGVKQEFITSVQREN